MIKDLIKNGISPQDIILLLDYPISVFSDFNAHVMYSEHPMPINWWHGVAAVLDTDYVALLCDDLTLRPKTLPTLFDIAKHQTEASVFGFEGGNFAKTVKPYTDAHSHTVKQLEPADYVIRFYFAKPEAFARALVLYHQSPKDLRGHDDLILSLANKCCLVPTTATCGWDELSEHNVAYSRRVYHYNERNELVRRTREL